MNIAFIIIYIITGINLLIAAYEHGKPKEGKNSFWVSIVSATVYLVLIWWAVGWKFT